VEFYESRHFTLDQTTPLQPYDQTFFSTFSHRDICTSSPKFSSLDVDTSLRTKPGRAVKHVLRFATKEMLCVACDHVQPLAQGCRNPNCDQNDHRYFCSECNLWENNPEKNIYHCPHCRICRVGKGLGQDYFHCMRCNACMSIHRQNHKCVENCMQSNCPICGDDLFTSTQEVQFSKCGHPMHRECLRQYLETNYTCPICSVSLMDMREFFARIDDIIECNPMPEQYDGWTSHIVCADCDTRSYAPYHFMYHKCGSCNSYNTRVLSHSSNDRDSRMLEEQIATEVHG